MIEKDTLPPSKPEISQEEWDAAIVNLSEKNNHQVSNPAAHNWAVFTLPDGEMIASALTDAYLFTGSDKPKKIDPPKICNTCYFTTRYLSQKGTSTPLRCSLGLPKLRPVGRIQTCASWSHERPTHNAY